MPSSVQATSPSPRDVVAGHLSAPRLAPYLAACSGNLSKALQLYRWNIELSGAVYEVLHTFEVVLRNAMDAQLGPWNAQRVDPVSGLPHSSDWLLDPSDLLKRLVRAQDLAQARDSAERSASRRSGSKTVLHVDMVAGLSLGTWRFLLPDADPGRQLLWKRALIHAFPGLVMTPAQLRQTVARINLLRNRVAHLEPLLRTHTVEKDLKGIRLVLESIDPTVASWAMSQQRITTVIKAKP